MKLIHPKQHSLSMLMFEPRGVGEQNYIKKVVETKTHTTRRNQRNREVQRNEALREEDEMFRAQAAAKTLGENMELVSRGGREPEESVQTERRWHTT